MVCQNNGIVSVNQMFELYCCCEDSEEFLIKCAEIFFGGSESAREKCNIAATVVCYLV